MCKGNLSRVSLARSVTRPQATGFALQNRTNTKKDTQKRVFFRVVIPQHYRFSNPRPKNHGARNDSSIFTVAFLYHQPLQAAESYDPLSAPSFG